MDKEIEIRYPTFDEMMEMANKMGEATKQISGLEVYVTDNLNKE